MQPLRRTQYRRNPTRPAANGEAPAGQGEVRPSPPLCQITLSFYLRDSAVTPPFTFGTQSMGFSRAASTCSPVRIADA